MQWGTSLEGDSLQVQWRALTGDKSGSFCGTKFHRPKGCRLEASHELFLCSQADRRRDKRKISSAFAPVIGRGAELAPVVRVGTIDDGGPQSKTIDPLHGTYLSERLCPFQCSSNLLRFAARSTTALRGLKPRSVKGRSIADVLLHSSETTLCANSALMHRSKLRPHWITSSAQLTGGSEWSAVSVSKLRSVRAEFGSEMIVPHSPPASTSPRCQGM